MRGHIERSPWQSPKAKSVQKASQPWHTKTDFCLDILFPASLLLWTRVRHTKALNYKRVLERPSRPSLLFTGKKTETEQKRGPWWPSKLARVRQKPRLLFLIFPHSLAISRKTSSQRSLEERKKTKT
jgi:hypothetical protein